METSQHEKEPEGQKVILNIYAAFGVSLILSVLPYMSAAILSIFFFMGVLIGAYVLRSNSETGSLQENHATYIIRTLWITAFFSLITTGIATAYMLSDVHYIPFDPCALALANKGVAWMESASMMDVYTIVEPCVGDFLDANKVLFLNAVLIAGAPLVIYMTYRLASGLSRATKGYRLSNSKAWF